MIKAAVAGACGKMGARTITLMAETEGLALVGALETKGHPGIGRRVAELYSVPWQEVIVVDDPEQALAGADVTIEFSVPNASVAHLRLAAEKGRAMVIGTTGFSAEQLAEIEVLTKKTPCVLSPNMSLGVNLMYGLIDRAARALGDDYDVEIYEAHHRMKRDAPSGTALKMAEVAARALGRDLASCAVWQRKGEVGPRSAKEIGLQAIRAGDIVGEHTVLFAGIGERLELIHRAHSRDTFARGALRAARWVVGRPPGLYDMGDVLGLKG